MKTTKKKCCANCQGLKQEYAKTIDNFSVYKCKWHRDYNHATKKGSTMMLALSLYTKVLTVLYCDKYKEAK